MDQTVTALSWVNIFVMLSIAIIPGVLTFIVGFFLLKKTVSDVVTSLRDLDKDHSLRLNDLNEDYHRLQVDMLTTNKDKIEAFMIQMTSSFSNAIKVITESNTQVVAAMLDLTRSNVEVVQSNIRAEDTVKRIHERLDTVTSENTVFQHQMIQGFRSTQSCDAMMKASR